VLDCFSVSSSCPASRKRWINIWRRGLPTLPSWLGVLCAIAGLLALAPLELQRASAEGRSDRPDVLSVEDIKPGMKGYGLTVFEGSEPSKFDVEVIDVLHNFRPHQALILIHTEHPRLEVAKVVAGMSGSPIYINGKMIGAYAYGWTFGTEPVAGVTPIRNMLDDLARPLPDFIYGWPLGGQTEVAGPSAHLTSRSETRYAGTPGSYNLTQHRDQIAEHSVAAQRVTLQRNSQTLTPVSTPLLLGGFSQEDVAFAESFFGPLGLLALQAGGGGGTEADAPRRFVDGGTVGVQMIRGDMSAMGLGTVTRVEGDKLVGFGHPMMNAGVSALPTAVAKVLWFLASQARSFKIGMPVRPLGALVNDRQASIVVSHSATAPTIPVHVGIHGVPGAPYADWNFEIAHEKFLTPSLIAVALGSSLQATAAERQDVSWNASTKIRFKDLGEITVEDFGVAVGGTPDRQDLARSNIVEAVGTVLNNPWQPAFVESIDLDVEMRYSREIYRLRGAELLNPEPQAGGEARIRLKLVPYTGEPRYQTVSLPIPRHLAGETVKVKIQPGYAVERVKAAPETLAELVRNLEDPIYPPKSVVLSYRSGAGVAHRGQVAHNLPAGALDTLARKTSSLAPETVTSEDHEVVMLDQFLLGKDTVTIQVKPNDR
jgi:hypothetical protein